MTTWQAYLAQERSRFLSEMLAFLSIPSISSLPANAADVRNAAEWVAARLTAAGGEHVAVMETGGHPIVYGDWLHAPGKPTVLIYGHFDTQPVDPLELWQNPPFEPTIIEDRVYARGASDDKGNMIIPILAVEALLKTEGRLPVNVKFFFEGQEEIGSPNLPPFIAAHKDLLACDLVLSADGGQYSEDQPGLTVGSKGLVGLQIDVKGAKSDLHSGGHGGAIQNPLHALVRLLDSMRSADGKILVEGFYDTVRPLGAEDRELIARVPFDEEAYKKSLDVTDVFGEPGYSTIERRWARPTLEINGIYGGFQGDGVKTVLPNEAHAKITCRLVADQDPSEIFRLIKAHVEKHAPKGVRISIEELPGSAKPYLMPTNHPGNKAAAAVLKEVFGGREPFYTRTGGTIPVCELFQSQLGVYTVGFAFGGGESNVHAPNEFFRLAAWDRGQRGYCLMLHQLAQGL